MQNANLIVMRHAEARPAGPGDNDFARPLTAFGARDAQRMGAWMREQLVAPKRVLASPAARTRETVAAIFDPVAAQSPEFRWDPRLYLADLPQLLEVLAEEPVSPLLLVGHNPGLEDLILYLLWADEPTTTAMSMPTAGVFALELPARKGPIPPGSAKLVAFSSPERLATTGP